MDDEEHDDIEILRNKVQECQIDVNEKLNFERSVVIPAASRKIAINEDEKGFGLVASEPITFGEIVLFDEPFAFVLFDQFRCEFCNSCLAALPERAINCSICDAHYCDKSCVKSSYHQHICNLNLKSLDASFKLVFFILLKALLKEEICFPVTSDRRIRSEWISNYQSLCRLTASPELSTEKTTGFDKVAELLIEAANKMKKPLPMNKHHLIELATFHYQQMDVNKVFLKESCFEIDLDMQLTDDEHIGLAIYPTLSLINHSCKPNVFLFFYDGKAIIKASKEIFIGEEIVLCYGPNYQTHSLKDRKAQLKKLYYFDCNCECCLNLIECPQIAFKCSDCEGPLILDKCDCSGHCLSCQSKIVNVSDRIEKVEQAKEELEKGRKLYENKQLDEAIQIISRNYNVLDDNLYKTNPFLVNTRKTLYKCLSDYGQYSLASRLCKLNVLATKEVYGNKSVEHILQVIPYFGYKLYHLEDVAQENPKQAESEAGQLEEWIDAEIENLKSIIEKTIKLQDGQKKSAFEPEYKTLLSFKEKCSLIKTLSPLRVSSQNN